MIKRRADVLPKLNMVAGKIGSEQQRRHVRQSKRTRCSCEDPKHKSHSDCEFPVGHQKGDRPSQWENELLQYRDKKGIGCTAFLKAMDPSFESAVQRKLRPEHLVFAEDQEDAADCDPQYRKSQVIPVGKPSNPFHSVTSL